MFSGKTTKLLELYNESVYEQHEKIAVKPLIDKRYGGLKINTHSGLQLPGHRLSKAEEIYPLIQAETKEIYIDEIQFFSANIISIIEDLNFQGIKVITAGLNLDYQGNEFANVAKLKQMATTKFELKAKCEICGLPAEYTFRLSHSSELVLIGGKDLYEPRCEAHWKLG
jgi:thymidine kinase